MPTKVHSRTRCFSFLLMLAIVIAMPVMSLLTFSSSSNWPVRDDSSSALDIYEDEMDVLVSSLFQLDHAQRKPRHVMSTCKPVTYKNVTHTKHKAFSSLQTVLPIVEYHHMLKEVGDSPWSKQQAHIHHQIINNPLTTWSVLEPGQPGSCHNDSGNRFTVQESSRQKSCLVAANAGFFNTTSGQCYGNIVSDSFVVQDFGGIQNVHFGLTKDGYIYTGYLSELDLILQDFTQLVGGVFWLVRDGVSYLDESMKMECSETQETGTLERFASVMSARTAVGHDKEGRIHMVQLDGKTNQYGVNLYDFTKIVIELGLHNAINLDGGGSATTVINGTVANFPSDHCINSSYNCERKVSTVICAHMPRCPAEDCSGHGTCDVGVCRCQGLWSGSGCEVLDCPFGCSQHGLCTEEGCRCYDGWTGLHCSVPCQEGWYGVNCSLPCLCQNGGSCSPATGECQCPSGYTGRYCHEVCSLGYFGHDCSQKCSCEQSCYCHHSTGSCNSTETYSQVYDKAVHCLAQQTIMKLNLVPSKEHQYSLCVTSVICLSVIALFSLLLNLLLSYLLVRSRRNYKDVLRVNRKETRRYIRRMRTEDKAKLRDEENSDDEDFHFKPADPSLYHARLEVDGAGTGSGEEEQDLFLAPKRKQ